MPLNLNLSSTKDFDLCCDLIRNNYEMIFGLKLSDNGFTHCSRRIERFVTQCDLTQLIHLKSLILIHPTVDILDQMLSKINMNNLCYLSIKLKPSYDYFYSIPIDCPQLVSTLFNSQKMSSLKTLYSPWIDLRNLNTLGKCNVENMYTTIQDFYTFIELLKHLPKIQYLHVRISQAYSSFSRDLSATALASIASSTLKCLKLDTPNKTIKYVRISPGYYCIVPTTTLKNRVTAI